MTRQQLTLETLTAFVAGGAVAIRGKAVLEPAGGPGDKVFPPTHSVDDRKPQPGARYAFERRILPGGEVAECVLLDSVQSQANRMEEALQALWAERRIALPVITVDFGAIAPEVGCVTSLTAPHRVADALLRDSLHGETLFRASALGKSFVDASIRNAGPLFRACPTALVFGLWDSTGPKGGRGAKFARALVSEIVGVGAVRGVKTSSRIDPAAIMRDAATIYVARERDADGNLTWTTDVMAAEVLDPAKPPRSEADADRVRKWAKTEKESKPAAINHGNIPPSIDDVAGGVTIDHAEQTLVLSLAALRRLSFGGGDTAARTVLAALALLAALAAEDRGHDLRSRCLLVPTADGRGTLQLEAVAKDGSIVPLALSLQDAVDLYVAAVAALPPELSFVRWGSGELLSPGVALAELTPSPKLQHLVIESRKLAAAGADAEGD